MSLSSRATAELLVIISSLGLFLGYHVWLFALRGRGYKVKDTYHDFFQAGKLARSLWAEACATDEKDAILGVQQARNAMTACTYLATISVVLATAGITIIFDESKIERMRQLAIHDPIMRNLDGQPLVQPTTIVACALGSLYCSFVCFGQSVRLYVHTGFYIRACTSRFNPGTLTVNEAKKVTIHAGVAFSVGLRLFYLFIPLVMWSIGVTALLVASVVMTSLIAYMDHFDMSAPDPDMDGPQDEAVQSLTAQHRQQDGPSQHHGTAQPAQQQPTASATAGRDHTVIELAATAGGEFTLSGPPSGGAGREMQQHQQQQQRSGRQHTCLGSHPAFLQSSLPHGADATVVVVPAAVERDGVCTPHVQVLEGSRHAAVAV